MHRSFLAACHRRSAFLVGRGRFPRGSKNAPPSPDPSTPRAIVSTPKAASREGARGTQLMLAYALQAAQAWRRADRGSSAISDPCPFLIVERGKSFAPSSLWPPLDATTKYRSSARSSRRRL